MAKICPAEDPETVTGSARSRLVLLCDHASNAIPSDYAGLGLSHEQLCRHIAYDIGARDLTLELARRLGAHAVLSRFSRLLIDPNRGLDDPTLIMRISDGDVVPGNRLVDDVERQRRIVRFHAPYHQAIAGAVELVRKAGHLPFLVSLHSFTPVWRGWPRPWHVGVLWDSDAAAAHAMIHGFMGQGDLVVGDNEPYRGGLDGDTLHIHGTLTGLPHALIEVRQDLIADKTGVDEWAERVAKVIEPIMYEAGPIRSDQGSGPA
jgi:predicted N-formylglutamate amidohydrolase